MKIAMLRERIWLSSALALSMLSVGCQKEGLSGGDGEDFDDGLIRYEVSVGGVQEGTVRSGVQNTTGYEVITELVSLSTLASDDGERSFLMGCERTYGIASAQCVPAETVTRGKLVNTGDGTDKLSKFADAIDGCMIVSAYTGGTTPYFTADPVKWNGSEWKSATPQYWPQATVLDCYAYANLPKGFATVTTDPEYGVQKLEYSVPASTDDQRDILISDRYHGSGNGKGTVSFTFYHPLTAVQFKLGEVDPSVTGIESITISGVHTSGNAVQSADNPADFEWTPAAASATVMQQSDGKLEVVGGVQGDPFLLIPQNLTTNSIDITVNLIIDGHGVPFNAMLNTGNWLAGYTYTYSIGYSSNMDIIVSLSKPESETEGSATRTNAVITNIGTKKCYVRATATGYITGSDGAIYSTWLDIANNNIRRGTFTVTDGTFGSTSAGWNTGWIQGSDGYWYYKTPLNYSGTEAERSTTPLFDSYKITSLKTGESFQMVLSAQCVEWDENKNLVTLAWGEAAAGLLE